jgi:hypothetical protein
MTYPIKFEPEDEANRDVHTEHCCKRHGCKYGNMDGECTVESGQKRQSHPCEECDGGPYGSPFSQVSRYAWRVDVVDTEEDSVGRCGAVVAPEPGYLCGAPAFLMRAVTDRRVLPVCSKHVREGEQTRPLPKVKQLRATYVGYYPPDSKMEYFVTGRTADEVVVQVEADLVDGDFLALMRLGIALGKAELEMKP